MKILAAIVLTSLCISASAEPATEASIDELMTVTHAAQMVEMMKDNFENGMRAGLKQAVQGKPLTTAQVAYLDAVPGKFRTAIDQRVQWSDVEPVVFKTYEENFSEKEVRAAINFYRSPEGSAFITKMPAVNQRAQELMMQHMTGLIQLMRDQMVLAIKEAQGIQ